MQIYKTKAVSISGTQYPEVNKKARNFYKEIVSKSKRKPYVRSAFFINKKVFLELFWIHLHQKSLKEMTKRLKLLPAGIELIKYSKNQPVIKTFSENNKEIFYRFQGVTNLNKSFFVQIKENLRTKERWLMSIFPDKK